MTTAGLFGAADLRARAAQLGIRPTKVWGQNFVIDPNTVRRIVRLAGVDGSDVVVEVGPGLGSLTLGLLEAGAGVVAIEIDPALAGALPDTVAMRMPAAARRLDVLAADALAVGSEQVSALGAPTALVANLPYNVAVPVLLHLLADVPSLQRALVMVQREVAERLAAPPGSRTYGVPSAKARWFGAVELAGPVPRGVFWPVPNVDSALVRVRRWAPPMPEVPRTEVFAVVDAAFGQRRKMLRSALASWAGSAAAAAELLRAAGVDPTARAEALDIRDFARIAAVAAGARPAGAPPAGHQR